MDIQDTKESSTCEKISNKNNMPISTFKIGSIITQLSFIPLAGP